MELLTKPWPWYISGPLIGLMVPLLLLIGNKSFGISSSLRHICAACIPVKAPFFQYNWKAERWNLLFALGIIAGGFLAGYVFRNPEEVALSQKTMEWMKVQGVKDFHGVAPDSLFNFSSLLTLNGWILFALGGFLVGFGTRYADGCTSGHAIMGLSNLQFSSLIATCCFFAGGLAVHWFVLPYLLN